MLSRSSKVVVRLALFSAVVYLCLLAASNFDDYFLDGHLRQYDVHDLLVPGAPTGSWKDAPRDRDPVTNLYPTSVALACVVRDRLEAKATEGNEDVLVTYPLGITGTISAYATWWGDRHVRAVIDDLRDEQDAWRAAGR